MGRWEELFLRLPLAARSQQNREMHPCGRLDVFLLFFEKQFFCAIVSGFSKEVLQTVFPEQEKKRYINIKKVLRMTEEWYTDPASADHKHIFLIYKGFLSNQIIERVILDSKTGFLPAGEHTLSLFPGKSSPFTGKEPDLSERSHPAL